MAGTVNDVEEKQGDCETCGSWSGRLLHAMCPWCRDRYKITSESRPNTPISGVSLLHKLWRRKL